MKKYEFYSLYDYTAIEEHLAKMAENGRLLEKIGPFCWTYRAIQPQKLRFRVTYFPRASRFDPGPSAELAEYADLADHTGWRRCAELEFLQIFCAADLSAPPMETDPALRVRAVHAACAKSVLPLGACMILMCGLMLTMLDTLPGLTAIFGGAVSALCIVYYIIELCVYALWLRRAVRAAEVGEFADSPRHSRFLRLLQWAAFGLMVAFGAGSLALGAGVGELAALLPVLTAELLFAGAEVIREQLRRRGTLRSRNRASVLAYSAAVFAELSVFSAMVR